MTASPGTDTVVVVTTTDSDAEAERLARGLVDAHLAACVQIVGPVRSAFRWEGAVSVETEWQLVAKTAADRVDDLTAWIAAEHSYDVPEVIALPVVGGHAPYLGWVIEETQREGAPDA
ncbi:divalent-cation tolerance protein CutA [Actinomycetospora endophytica]|uniref:Divalent-cation tolerance protein CutA n=1 Tax=Actinomycetospora endophytica TaxID=2291215 RepID=A0ABS8P492_9PSEU|nr:divalent-cation tolerance protein CutA [Actinomycetospora endophytica]MCD2193081.1 divalent-cation tolerance protein CutA [Actinomycetospora endophytica]